MEINPQLRAYVERDILPRYEHFDAAHQRDHALTVIDQSLSIVATLNASGRTVNPDMAYAIAAFHDTGLCEGREVHHLASGRIIRADKQLRQWFTDEQIEVMAQAAEDHRASAKMPPRSIYGRIVAEADRVIVPEVIVRRTIQFGLDHYPELSREEHFDRMAKHLKEKYGPDGYLKLWFTDSPNAERLEELRRLMADQPALHVLFDRLFTTLVAENCEHGLL